MNSFSPSNFSIVKNTASKKDRGINFVKILEMFNKELGRGQKLC